MPYKANTFKNEKTGTISRRASKKSTTGSSKERRSPSLPIDYTASQEKAFKIIGLFLIILSALFAFAFVSYLFTWEEDQSYIAQTNGGWSTLFNTASELEDGDTELPIVQNKLGKFGALLAHQFIYNWFGIASFVFILVLFVVGYRLLYRKSVLPVWKTIIYSFVTLVFVSVTLGFVHDFFNNAPHILEGKFGYWSNQLLKAQIGQTGVLGILVFAYLTALILIYNLDLKVSWFGPSADREFGDLEDEQDNEGTYIPPYNRVNKETIREERLPHHYIDTPEDLPEEETAVNLIKETVVDSSVASSTAEAQEEDYPKETILRVNSAPDSSFSIATPLEEDHTIGFTIDQPQEEILVQAEEAPADALTLTVEEPQQEKEITANDLVKQFGEYDPKLDLSGYQHPTLDLLKDYGTGKITINQQELEANKNKIVDTLRHYNIEIEHIKATIGPTVTLYEIIPKPGVRISKIKNLEDDIALSLAALGIRIIAPMPGKGTIGIEVPNSNPEMVSMRSVLMTEKFQKTDMDLPIALGKTISNEVYIADLAKMPHLLVAGATGQGKSVGINAILTSLLYKKHPAELKFVLVDPKKVELSLFKKVERHFLAKLPGEEDAIITDTKKVINTLNSLCIEMDQRYDLLKNAQVRNLKEYNVKFINRRLNPEEGHRFLPFIVLIVDEFADLMMTAGKEVETPIARLAQLARAVGIHLVIATQRPSVNIITGTIKANFPARLAFRVLSKVDSRTILDSGGADQLIGRGDMLLATGSDLIRIQCAFVDTPEVEEISDFIGGQRGYASAFMLPEYVDENGDGSGLTDIDLADRDQLFEDAARLIVLHQQGSTSLIQRKLKLGYNRAGRIIDQLEAAGIVGPFEGSKAREVLYPDEYSLEQYLDTLKNKN